MRDRSVCRDGYTLLPGNPSLGISPHIYPKLSYRPLVDLAFVKAEIEKWGPVVKRAGIAAD
jgi:hypothetical protein